MDLDWFVWPPAPSAWPHSRGRLPKQLRQLLSPAELAAELARLGYDGAPARVLASHEEVLALWRDLAPAERTVVHIDAHHDLVGARGGLVTFDRRTGREVVGPANFLRLAAWSGLVGRVLWVVPDRMWRSPRRIAFECEAFSADLPAAGQSGLVCRLPASVEVEVLPLRHLPPADGPMALRSLALSPEWIDWRLYRRLAPQAVRALVPEDPRGRTVLDRTRRWPLAPSGRRAPH